MSWWMLAPMGLLLGWITVQDFRERQVSLLGLVMLFILGLFYSCLALQWTELIRRVAFNSLFAGIIMVSGTLLVKLRRPGDSVSSFIGSGDFLFLLSISPLFAFGAFLVFLNTSMILVLAVFGVLLALGRIKGGAEQILSYYWNFMLQYCNNRGVEFWPILQVG